MLHFELLQEDRLEQGVMFADGSVSQPPENDSIFVQKPVFLWSCSIVMLSVRWDMCRLIIFVFYVIVISGFPYVQLYGWYVAALRFQSRSQKSTRIVFHFMHTHHSGRVDVPFWGLWASAYLNDRPSAIINVICLISGKPCQIARLFTIKNVRFQGGICPEQFQLDQIQNDRLSATINFILPDI